MASQERQIYDDVAGDYDIIWKTPACTIMLELVDQQLRAMGDWKGAHVLDLACGTGIGLREARKLGATSLVGVDISGEMVQVAKESEAQISDHHPVPLQLHVADCSQPLGHLGLEPGSFDLVIAMWLLNYAETAEQMAAMWSNIATYLKPGGKFVGIIQNFKHVPTSVESHKYGARVSYLSKIVDGAKLHVDFSTEPKIEFDIFVLDQNVFEKTCAQAGLHDLTYVRPTKETLSPEEQENMEWWQELIDEYPNQIVVATKA